MRFVAEGRVSKRYNGLICRETKFVIVLRSANSVGAAEKTVKLMWWKPSAEFVQIDSTCN